LIYSIYSAGANLKSLEEQRKASAKLLSYGLCMTYQIEEKNIDIVHNCFGKPFFKEYRDIFFNIAHCENGVAVIFSDRRVGIDIEKVREYNVFAARKVLDEFEMDRIEDSDNPSVEFFRYWTVKESYIKALGTGFSYPLKKIKVILEKDGQVHTNVKGARFDLYENQLGFIIATCHLNGNGTQIEKANEQSFTLP